jgi:hypothetical protein
MKCPFRVGAFFEYQFIGNPSSKEDKQNSDKYIEIAQHALFEECEEEDCPYYDYNGACGRIEGE